MTDTFNRQPPGSEAELLHYAAELAGLSIAQLATRLQIEIPTNPVQAKGWTGEMVERFLGASAASLPEPDFQAIGVELKTLPVNARGTPAESTYVCTAPVTNLTGLTWDTSTVKWKLARVLWVPVEGDKSIAFPERRFGNPMLWSPDSNQEHLLRTDWEEIIEQICLGQLAGIHAGFGKVLQLRPKAANAAALTTTYNERGESSETLPRGFYLRASFTKEILNSV